MEDDHVDRTGVEAQQCVKLTVTNSSIGLIVLIVHAHRTSQRGGDARRVHKQRQTKALPSTSFSLIALSRPGGYGGVAAPVPIPNTAVKRPSANGTSS